MDCSICKASNPPGALSCRDCGALLMQAARAPQASAPQVTPAAPSPASWPPPAAPSAPPGAVPPGFAGATRPSPQLGGPTSGFVPPLPGAHVVRVSARTLTWPRVCVCCSGTPDSQYRAEYTRTTGKRVVRTDTRFWEVPYCSTCLNHVRLMQAGVSKQSTGTIVAVLSAILLPCLFFVFFIPLGTLILGLVMISQGNSLKRQAEQATTAGCGCAAPAVDYHGWDGSIQTFTFRNGVYAETFRAANARKLLG